MNRSSVASVALVVVFLGSVAGLASLYYQQAAFLRGWEIPTDSGATLPYRLPLAGVNADLTQYDDEELSTHLEAMERLGITWVRQPFRWAESETQPGEYAWDAWDRVVDAAVAHPSLRLVAVLLTTPSWARHSQAPDSLTAPPARNADFTAFAAAFADRYGDRID